MNITNRQLEKQHLDTLAHAHKLQVNGAAGRIAQTIKDELVKFHGISQQDEVIDRVAEELVIGPNALNQERCRNIAESMARVSKSLAA